ncbi:MAG TPA: GDSL-type esterase/lipase family protein [Candidatus Cloacimonadota bacterium]|nr:GDSL-type esterase/lipase family protein [Candidatus Cloacimonadota bacterium]HPS39902.1 GDSL-type esterase/lipase family protein [Candidatus Cloacimonadota bacterium]
MRHLRSELLIVLLLLLFSMTFAGDSPDESDINQSMLDEQYPSDIDTLEEFIQSYYLLLDSQVYLQNYHFLKAEDNYIRNDSLSMNEFYSKLVQLRNGMRKRVTIYQIGDSHIQSGYFAGTARSALQKHFGNAGRGLSFPLRLAGTNQPDDYRISSSSAWSRLSSKVGLSGFSLSTRSSGSISIKTNEFFGSNNSHDLIRVLYEGNYSWTMDAKPGEITEHASGIRISSLSASQPASQLNIGYTKLDGGDQLNLYGLSMERSEPGLIFHSAGVNGASYDNLSPNTELFKQISALEPDLIIISLGTNDAQGNYRAEMMKAQMKKFMTQMEKENPKVPILFTTPPDTYKRGVTNNDVYKVGEELAAYANSHGYAWWDLASAMGGKGSIRQWKSASLAANDMLHFAPKGYMLQGYLLYQAMIKGYKKYTEQAK